MTDKDSLLAAVESAPSDAAPKLVLADWYEERGYPTLAAVWRWLGRTGRHPGPVGCGPMVGWAHESLALHFGWEATLPDRLYFGLKDRAARAIELAVALIVPAWVKATKPGWFRAAWVPPAGEVPHLTPADRAFLKATGGVR
jgi:uncharacterized protein (TIGR02996 family)